MVSSSGTDSTTTRPRYGPSRRTSRDFSRGKAAVLPGSDDLDAAAQARHATSVEALALLLFGLLAGVVTLTLIAQAFARQVYLDADEYATVRAMGMTRKQLVATATIRATLISVVGVGLAVVVADRGFAAHADRFGTPG